MTFTTRTEFEVGLRVPEPFDVDLAGATGTAHVHYQPGERGSRTEGLLTVTLTHADDAVEAKLPISEAHTDDATYESVVPFGNRVAAEHQGIAEQCVGYLRWRFNLEGAAEAVTAGVKFTWATREGRSGPVPQSFDWAVSFGLSRSRLTRLDFPQGIVSGILGGPREPLGHVLLREAAALVHSNPRASLVLAVTALEVGVKRCIANVAPDTTWLLENLQSPPLDKLLRNYLPTLAKRAGSDIFPLPSETMKEIVVAMAARNQLVHRGHVLATSPLGRTGSGSPTPDRLSDLLRTIHGILYRLDVVRGHAWAVEYTNPAKVSGKLTRS